MNPDEQTDITKISDLKLAEQIGVHQEILMQSIAKEQEENMQLNALKNEVLRRTQVIEATAKKVADKMTG